MLLIVPCAVFVVVAICSYLFYCVAVVFYSFHWLFLLVLVFVAVFVVVVILLCCCSCLFLVVMHGFGFVNFLRTLIIVDDYTLFVFVSFCQLDKI